jgi:uncharacterized protein
MANPLKMKRWSPYLVGVLIGVLSWVTFLTMDKPLSTSTTIPKTAGFVTGLVAPTHVAENAYYAKDINPPDKPMFDWQFFLVVALAFGALLAAKLAGSTFKEKVPPVWQSRFGPNKWGRYAGAFIGGVIILYGARMAGGCTSGHGISGGLQFALSSWLFFFSMFISGVITAFALFGMKGRQHVQL